MVRKFFWVMENFANCSHPRSTEMPDTYHPCLDLLRRLTELETIHEFCAGSAVQLILMEGKMALQVHRACRSVHTIKSYIMTLQENSNAPHCSRKVSFVLLIVVRLCTLWHCKPGGKKHASIMVV